MSGAKDEPLALNVAPTRKSVSINFNLNLIKRFFALTRRFTGKRLVSPLRSLAQKILFNIIFPTRIRSKNRQTVRLNYAYKNTCRKSF